MNIKISSTCSNKIKNFFKFFLKNIHFKIYIFSIMFLGRFSPDHDRLFIISL